MKRQQARGMLSLISLTLLFTACAVPQTPVPQIALTTVCLPQPVERIDVLQVPSAIDQPMSTSSTPASLKRIVSRPGRQSAPTQIVTEAQKEARVYPEEKGFFAKSGEYSFTWTPGRIYVLYLSQKQPTGLFLPPGERMVSGLYLSPNQFEVHSERAGAEPLAYDAITILPTFEKGEIDSFILTESGRRYLLHLVIGPVSMLAVTFETPSISQAAPEPRLTLPRPTP